MMGGISIWHFLIIMVLPLIHVILSSRSHGGAKFGWSLAVVFFPLLSYIIYLIVTQPAKRVQQS
ncbi:PLDc N-terminal domain-containing protein [Alishewanella maricola]